jgi:hypothetical protein
MLSTAAGRPWLGTAGRRPTWLVALFALGLGFAAFLLSAMVGLGAWVPVFGLIVLAGFGLAIAWGIAGLSQGAMSLLLFTVLAVTLIHPPLGAMTGLPLGYLFEAICFSLLIGAGVHAYRQFGDSPWLRALTLLTLAYFALALVSSVLGRSQKLAGLWQLQYNLKLPAMFLIGLMLSFNARQQGLLIWFARLAWLPIAAFVLLEIVAPSTYEGLMGQPIDHTPNPLIGWGVRRAGPFQHSGLLAMTVAMLCWFCLVYAWQRRDALMAFNALPYLGLVLLSGQRQESLALALGMLVLAVFALRRHWRTALVVGGLLTALLVTLALIFELGLAKRFDEAWGAGEGLDPVSERTVLTRTGIAIAEQWAPLGSGLGTYGSAGAQKFDQSQFEEYGFGKLWWFRRGLFLIDVYWPSVAAEAGFLAAGLWLLALLLLLLLIARQAWRDGASQPIAWLGTGAMVLMLGNSPTSAALTDPRLTFWLWLLVGAAAAHAMRASRGGERAVDRVQRRMSELGAPSLGKR